MARKTGERQQQRIAEGTLQQLPRAAVVHVKTKEEIRQEAIATMMLTHADNKRKKEDTAWCASVARATVIEAVQ